MNDETTKLPPDPENMNEQRADWAEGALNEYMAETGCNAEDVIGDLIGSIHHLCDRQPQFGNASERIAVGYNAYLEETCQGGMYAEQWHREQGNPIEAIRVRINELAQDGGDKEQFARECLRDLLEESEAGEGHYTPEQVTEAGMKHFDWQL